MAFLQTEHTKYHLDSKTKTEGEAVVISMGHCSKWRNTKIRPTKRRKYPVDLLRNETHVQTTTSKHGTRVHVRVTRLFVWFPWTDKRRTRGHSGFI